MLSLKTNAIHVIALMVCMLFGGIGIENVWRVDWNGSIFLPLITIFSLVLGLAGGVVTGYVLGVLRFRMGVSTATNFALHYLVLLIASILGLVIDTEFVPKPPVLDVPTGFGIVLMVYFLTSWVGVLLSFFTKFLYE